MNWLDVERRLKQTGQKIFTPLELMRISGISEIAVRFFLHRYTKKGVLRKIKNGLYLFSDNMPSELEIANRLYVPSYVSFEYALSFYHIMPETVYTVMSATPKPTREFIFQDVTYQYNRIKKSAFVGYEPMKKDGTVILIASPEKALVDYLYFVSLKKKPLNERLRTKNLNKNKALILAKKFDRDNLMALLKEIL